jgi:hypothetical protein
VQTNHKPKLAKDSRKQSLELNCRRRLHAGAERHQRRDGGLGHEIALRRAFKASRQFCHVASPDVCLDQRCKGWGVYRNVIRRELQRGGVKKKRLRKETSGNLCVDATGQLRVGVLGRMQKHGSHNRRCKNHAQRVTLHQSLPRFYAVSVPKLPEPKKLV